MLYNKNQFRKTNDKKVLHKIGKHWVAVSVATLMALGAGAVSTTVHANADTNAANGVRVTSNANVSHRTLANRQSANAQSSNSNSANPANNKYATLSVASTFANHDEATKAAPDVTTTAGYKAASEAFANVAKNAGVNENTDQVYAKDGSTNKSGSSLDSSILQKQASEIPSTASNGAYASDYNDFLTSQAISDAELGRWHGVSAGSYGSEDGNPTYNALSSDESAQPDNPYIKAYEGAQSAMSAIANNSYGSNSYNNTDSTDSNYASGFNAIISEYNNGHVAYADNWAQFDNAYSNGYASHGVSTIKLTNDISMPSGALQQDVGDSDLTVDGQNHIGNFSDFHSSPFQNQHHNLVVENFRKMYSKNYYGPLNEWNDNGGSVTFKNINYEGSQLFNGNEGIKLYIKGTVNVLSESSYNDPFDGVNHTIAGNGDETGAGQQNVEIASMEMMPNAVFNGVENDGGNNIEIGHSAQGALTLDQNSKMHLINNNRTDVGTPEYNGPSTKALYDNGDVNIQQGAQLSIDANNGANAMYVASGHNVTIDGKKAKLITNVNGDSSDNNGPIQIAGKVNVENDGTFDANASNLGNSYNKTILNDASGHVNVTNGANFVITDTDSSGQPVLFHGSGLTIEDPGSNVEFNLNNANGTLYNSTLNAYSVILEKTGTDGVPYYLSKNGKFDTKDIDSANPYYELTTDENGNVSYYDPVQNKSVKVKGNNGNISGSKDMKFIATPTSYFDGHINVNQSDSNNNNYLVSGKLLLSNVTSGYINQPVYMRVYDNGVTDSNDRTQGMEGPSTSDGEKINSNTNKNDPVLYNYKLQPVTSNGSVEYLVYKANGSGGWAPTSQVFDVNGSGQTGSNTVNGSKSRIVPFTFQMQNAPKSSHANVAVDAHYVVSTQEDDIYDNGNGVAEKKSALNPQNGPQNAGGGNIPNVNGGIKNNADNNKKPNTPSGDNGINFDNNITSDSNTASSAASETNNDSSNSAVASNPTASNAVSNDAKSASSDSSLISSADNTYPWNSSQNSQASSAANNAASNAANADSWVASVDNSGANSNSTVTSNDAKSAESSANNLSSGSAKNAAESDANNASGYVSGASKAASDASQASHDASVASSAASSASKAGDSVDASIASNSASSAAARANNDSKNASNDASAASSASNAVNNDINNANYKSSIASDSSNASSASNEVKNDSSNPAVSNEVKSDTSNSNALQSDIASENSDSNVIKSSQVPYNSAQNSTDSSAANNADSAAANADSIVASVDSSSAASDSNAAASDASSAGNDASGLSNGTDSESAASNAASKEASNASEDASVASSAASDASDASSSAKIASQSAASASQNGNSVAASIASNAASSAASRANNDNNIASNAANNAASASNAANSDASAANSGNSINYSNDIKSDSIDASSASSEINKDSSNPAVSGNTNAINTISNDARSASNDISVINSNNTDPYNSSQNSSANSAANNADSAAANADSVITSVDNSDASNNANNASNIANSASNSANGLNNDTPSASAASDAAKSDASNAVSDASAASSAANDAKSASNDASSASAAASSASSAGDSIAASSASNAASSAAARANNDSNIASNAAINASSASNAVNSDRNATSFEPQINNDSNNASSAANEANSGASNPAVSDAIKNNSSISNAISADIKSVNSDNSGINSSDAKPQWNNSQNSEASSRANNADSVAANVDSIIASVDNSGASSNANNAVSSANSVKSDASGLNSGSDSDSASSNAKVASKDASAANNAASDASIASSEASSASNAASSASAAGNSIAASSASIDASSAASRANTDSSNAANDASNAASAASAAKSDANSAGSVTPPAPKPKPNNGPVNPTPSPAPFVPTPSVPTTPSVNPRPANGPSTVVQPSNNNPKPVHITNQHYPIQYNYHHSGNDVVTVRGHKYPVHYHSNGKNTVNAKVGRHYRNVIVSRNLPTPHADSLVVRAVDLTNFNRRGKRVFTKRGLMKAVNSASAGELINYRGQKFTILSVPGHFRYFMVKKNVMVHSMVQNVGRAASRRILRKNHGLTIPIKRIVAVRGQHANYVRYEFSVNHRNFWVTGRNDYVPNAYLQKFDFADRKASHVKVMRGCNLYSSRRYNRRTYVKTLRRGTTLHVKKVIFLGAKGNYQTRLQLTNGDYVTANKNWVKVY